MQIYTIQQYWDAFGMYFECQHVSFKDVVLIKWTLLERLTKDQKLSRMINVVDAMWAT